MLAKQTLSLDSRNDIVCKFAISSHLVLRRSNAHMSLVNLQTAWSLRLGYLQSYLLWWIPNHLIVSGLPGGLWRLHNIWRPG